MSSPISDLVGYQELDQKEKQHLLDQEMRTVDDAIKTFSWQREQRHGTMHGQGSEPCWECKRIATKLGFPV